MLTTGRTDFPYPFIILAEIEKSEIEKLEVWEGVSRQKFVVRLVSELFVAALILVEQGQGVIERLYGIEDDFVET